MVLAASVGAGGVAFLIVLALIAVSIGLFYALSGSLRRLRQNVARGQFEGEVPPAPAEPAPPGRRAAPRRDAPGERHRTGG